METELQGLIDAVNGLDLEEVQIYRQGREVVVISKLKDFPLVFRNKWRLEHEVKQVWPQAHLRIDAVG